MIIAIWILGGLTAWTVLVAAPIGVVLGRMIRNADREQEEARLRPVPPTRSRHSDAEWLAAWPTDAALTDTEIERRFADITRSIR